MGWLKEIFSGPSTVDRGLDLIEKGASGIEKFWYTDEEKAEARKSWWKEVFLPLEKALAPQGAIRSVTRRILANGFCKTYLFLFIAAFGVYPVEPKWSAMAIELIKILTLPVSGIILFFFGSYGYGEYIKKKKDGESKQ